MAISARMPSTAVWLLLLLAMVMVIAEGGSSTAHVSQDTQGCLSEDEAVFLYWSACTDGPARYAYDGGSYYVAATWGTYLEPEWDESNATYYVRLSITGDGRYGFTHATKEWRSAVLLNDTFFITNLDTGRNLAWREEGDERFLIETDYANGSLFQFSRDRTEPAACPRILGALCIRYNIITADSSSSGSNGLGLASYIEDGAVYFKEQSYDLFSFFLVQSSIAGGVHMPTHHPLH